MLTTPSGKHTIDNYTLNKTPIRNKVRTTPSIPSPQTKGWHPKHTTFTTKPINPDLDSVSTGSFQITRHFSNDIEVLLHALDESQLTRMAKARLQKLNALYIRINDKTTLPEALAELTHRHTAINITQPDCRNQTPQELQAQTTAKTKWHMAHPRRPIRRI